MDFLRDARPRGDARRRAPSPNESNRNAALDRRPIAVRVWLTGLLLAALVSPAHAQATSAALIEAGNPELRSDIQWLVDRGIIDFSTSTWPVSLDALQFALERRAQVSLSAADQAAVRSVTRYLQLESENLGMELAGTTDASLSSEIGSMTHSRARLGVYARGDWKNVSAKLQLNGLHRPATDSRSSTSLEGSYLSSAFWGQLFYAGQLARWWGPGQDQSLIWSNAAPAIPTLGLRRGRESAPGSRWLSWIGSWGYDVSIGELQHYTSNPGTRIFSARLYARPIRGLEIGASRLIQWGGQNGNGLSALGDALVGQSNSPHRPPNNEVAGFDVRYNMPFRTSALAIYGQAVGEDEAGLWPAKFVGLVGAEYKFAWRGARLQWHVEAADTKTNRLFRNEDAGLPGVAYSHSFFKDGLYHDGLPIAARIGGDGRMYSLGLRVMPDESPLDVRYGFKVIRTEASGTGSGKHPLEASEAWGASAGVSWQFRKMDWRAEVFGLHGQGRPSSLGAGLYAKLRF